MFRVTTELTGTDIVGGGQNQLYFAESGGTAQQAQVAAATFWGTFTTNIGTGNVMTTSGEVATVEEASGEITDVTTLLNVVSNGAAPGEALPRATQGLCKLLTGTFVNGRQVQGRIFLPAFTETASLDGVPDPSIVTKIGASGAALIADANSTLVVWHRPKFDENGNITAPGLAVGVNSAVGWNQWAVLRSRRD